MASRHEEGFYRRLQSFSTADEWKALQSPVKRTSKKADVYEVEYILGKRKRKVRQFSFYVFVYSKLNYHTYILASKASI